MASSINASTTSGIVQTADTSGILNLQTANTTAVTIDASQNVGVGGTATANGAGYVTLGVNGTTAGIVEWKANGVRQAQSYATTSQYTVGSTTAIPLVLTTNNTECMRINASGNVGIGTTSPVGKLSVSNSGAEGIEFIPGNVSNVSTTQYYNRSGAAYTANVQNASYHSWLFSGTERVRLDASGNLLVGTTAQIASGKLSLAADHVTHQGIAIKNTNAANALVYIYFLNSAGVGAGTITQTAATTVAYATSSDYRLKENVTPLIGALDTVAKLKPVTYNWVADGSDGQGFIAHELAEIVPDCVVGEKDAVNEDGSIKAQAIDTSFLVATLTAAIQEQQALITSLTARLDEQQAQISVLQGAK